MHRNQWLASVGITGWNGSESPAGLRRNTQTMVSGIADVELARAEREVAQGLPVWSEVHLATWAATYKAFGARPNRTPCSAEALRKRVLAQGGVPRINPVVDLYNAISLRYAVPVGGEDADRYVGAPRLVRADGTEPFDTQANGQPISETPDRGEVVWRDDTGVTCRRWNWRQGTRTRLSVESMRMWFILEGLEGMPRSAFFEAGEQLLESLLALCPGATATKLVIEARDCPYMDAN